jgi:hypothetical protein
MGRGGGLEAQAGTVAVRAVAAVVEDGEQVAAVLDGQTARIAAGGLRVVAGQMAADAELAGGRRRRGRRRPGGAPPYASRFLERDIVVCGGLKLADVRLAVAVARCGEELDAGRR